MATQSSVDAQRRRDAILEVLTEDGAVDLHALAQRFDVSAMTIRRDLESLEREGVLQRVRGGAVATIRPRTFGERRGLGARAKQLIASKAVRLFPRSGAVALDASSTIGTLAGRMRGAWSVTVATNSYENFTALAAIPKVTPVLAGGELEPSTGSLVGPITCAAAESLVYQRFFLSASAVDAVHGTSEVSLAEAEVKRAFAGRSRETVLCVDSTKLGQLSSAAGFPLSAIDVMITELAPSDPRLDPYRGLVELV